MTRTIKRATGWALIACLGAGLHATDALAWGPKAERSLALMGMQLIQREHPNVFTPAGGESYANDVYRGANDGLKAVGDVPMIGDEEVFKAIEEEIQLLRDVRDYGPSSYFAYRMGALSTMVGNVMMPFGYAMTAADKRLQQEVRGEIDQHLESFHLSSGHRRVQMIRNSSRHFNGLRPFFHENERRIADEYNRGVGYNGFMKQAAPDYYEDAALAIADAWHTVLAARPETVSTPTPRPRLAEYFVSEVDYLLNVRDNYFQANRVYPNFRKVNPDNASLYERLGDLYYDYGLSNRMRESTDRGVREWQVAHGLRGQSHTQISRKLSNHFIRVGKERLEAGQEKGAGNEELPTAMENLETAIKYDPANREAPGLIEETQRAIRERQNLLEGDLRIIASADEVRSVADRAFNAQDYGAAITSYGDAINFYKGVGDFFTELYESAQDSISDVTKSINAAVEKVEDQANDAIGDGETALEERDYDIAKQHFNRAKTILGNIPPEGVSPSAMNMKETTLAAADEAIERAQAEQLAEQNRRQALQQVGGAPQPR